MMMCNSQGLHYPVTRILCMSGALERELYRPALLVGGRQGHRLPQVSCCRASLQKIACRKR